MTFASFETRLHARRPRLPAITSDTLAGPTHATSSNYSQLRRPKSNRRPTHPRTSFSLAAPPLQNPKASPPTASAPRLIPPEAMPRELRALHQRRGLSCAGSSADPVHSLSARIPAPAQTLASVAMQVTAEMLAPLGDRSPSRSPCG